MVPRTAAARPTADEQALAERYAPVVRLVAQTRRRAAPASRTSRSTSTRSSASRPSRCAARGATATSSRSAPTADDLADGPLRVPPRLPRERARPGLRLRALGAAASPRDTTPTVYAHVATEPGHPGQARAAVLALLRLQRLEQPARGRLGDDPARLRRRRRRRRRSQRTPVEVGYSQHEGAERARPGTTTSSSSSTARTRSCTRRPARTRTSTATALLPRQLGRAGRRLRRHARPARSTCGPVVQTIPSDRRGRGAAFPWIAFQGRWGELQPAFFNGPTGPNLKTQWTQPITLVARAGATAQLHRAGRQRVRDRRRPTSSAARSATGSRALVQLVAPAARVHASCSRRSRSLLLVGSRAHDVAPGRAASPRAPARVGPDPRGRGAHVRRGACRCSSGSACCSSRSRCSSIARCRRSCCTRPASLGVADRRPRPAGCSCFFVLAIGTALTLLGLGLRAGGDGAGARRDRRRAARSARCAPTGSPSDSIRPLLGALLIAAIVVSLLVELALPDPDRGLARRPLGADRAGDRARGRLGARRACAAAAASSAGAGSRSRR